jgi:hypothetical protein
MSPTLQTAEAQDTQYNDISSYFVSLRNMVSYFGGRYKLQVFEKKVLRKYLELRNMKKGSNLGYCTA